LDTTSHPKKLTPNVIFISFLHVFLHRDLKKLRKDNSIVLERHDLTHNFHQNSLTVDLLIEAPDINPEYPRLFADNETTAVTIPKRIFEILRRNESEVYFHVVLLRSGPGSSKYINVNNEAFKRGDALFGSVKLVKYNVIPRHFRYRYLLSDFDLVQLSDIESKFFDVDVATYFPVISIETSITS
jgi:hypothetical protein